MTTNQRLSGILHADTKKTPDLSKEMELSVEDQVQLMHQGPGCREDKLFKDVWLKNDGSVVAVRDMSLDHMCMTIGLWLRKEFTEVEQAKLGLPRLLIRTPWRARTTRWMSGSMHRMQWPPRLR